MGTDEEDARKPHLSNNQTSGANRDHSIHPASEGSFSKGGEQGQLLGGMESDRPGYFPVNVSGGGASGSAIGYGFTVRSGPLPSADEFAAYGRVIPDAPERILSMAEKSLDAENYALTEPIRVESRVLQAATWSIVLLPWACLLTTIVLAVSGHSVISIYTGIATAVTAGPSLIGAIRKR